MCGFIGLLLLSYFILMCMWVLYLTDIFFVLLCESEGVTWFALNETKTTRKVQSLAAHRKKGKERMSGISALNPSIWACRSLDSMHLIDLDSGASLGLSSWLALLVDFFTDRYLASSVRDIDQPGIPTVPYCKHRH